MHKLVAVAFLAVSNARKLRAPAARLMTTINDVTSPERLQQHMDAVDISASPRVELTYAPAKPVGVDQSKEAVGVLDSSFNPPTIAHVHMLYCAAEQFRYVDLASLALRNSPTRAIAHLATRTFAGSSVRCCSSLSKMRTNPSLAPASFSGSR